MLPGDRFADASHDLGEIQIPALRPLDFLHYCKLFILFLVKDGERCAAIPTQRRMAFLDGFFDILRVVVRATDDYEVLDPSGDEQSPLLVQEPEIAGSQPAALRDVHEAGMERVRRGLLVAPITVRDMRPADPDLAKLARCDPAARVRIDDRDL